MTLKCTNDRFLSYRPRAGSPLIISNLLWLSWTHIIELIWIDEPLKRSFCSPHVIID